MQKIIPDYLDDKQFSLPTGQAHTIELWKSGVWFRGLFLILCPGKYKQPCNAKHNGWTEKKSRFLWKYGQLEPGNYKFSLVTSIQEFIVPKNMYCTVDHMEKNLIEVNSVIEKEC